MAGRGGEGRKKDAQKVVRIRVEMAAEIEVIQALSFLSTHNTRRRPDYLSNPCPLKSLL